MAARKTTSNLTSKPTSKSTYGRDMTSEIDFELLSRLDKKDARVACAVADLTNKNYIFEHYNISLCTDESTNIFINVINKLTYQNYESIIRVDDLNSGLDISKFFKIVSGCFESRPNYFFKCELKPDMLIFYFTVCFDGFYSISQNIELMEKEFSQDKQSSSKIIELETRIAELETQEIILGYDSTAYGTFIKIKKNVELIDFREWADPKFKWYDNLCEFNNFVNLKKIIINDDQLIMNLTTNLKFGTYGLTQVHITTSIGNVLMSYSIPNMFDNPQIYFPNVTEIVIHKKSSTDFNPLYFRSLPKLTKVVFEQYVDTQIKTFDFIKNNKIKHVVYNNCLNVHELELIKNYFATNNFVLKITKV